MQDCEIVYYSVPQFKILWSLSELSEVPSWFIFHLLYVFSWLEGRTGSLCILRVILFLYVIPLLCFREKNESTDRKIANKIEIIIVTFKIFRYSCLIQVPWLPRLNQLQVTFLFLNLSGSRNTYYIFIIDYTCALSIILSIPRLQTGIYNWSYF